MAVEDKYRPVSLHEGAFASPAKCLLTLWCFAALLALYTAADVHAWLATRKGAGELGRRTGEAILAAGEATSVVAAREVFESHFDVVRNPPRLFAAPAEPTEEEPAVAEAPEPGHGAGVLPGDGSPRRILLAGASSIEFNFGIELERCLESYVGVEVRREGALGTGLARPQDLDWFVELARLQQEYRPDLVLGQLGGNDCTSAWEPRSGKRWYFGTKAWDAEYRRRVGQLVGEVASRGARMGFLGQFAVRRPGNRSCFARVDEATRAGALDAGAWFLSLRPLTLRGSDSVLETVPGPRGTLRKLWTRDDLHLTRAGAEVIAAKVCTQLERRLSLESPDPEKGRVHRFRLDSAARGRKVTWYAVLPRVVPAEGVPVLYLLHGGGGGAEDWMRAQDTLQRLAVEHAIAIVVPDGGEWSWYADGLAPGTAVERWLIRELVPEVERRLPVRKRRGIGGLSMGGHGALSLALRNPGVFASASSMSGVVDLLANPSRRGLVDVLGDPQRHPQRWIEHSARHLVESRPASLSGLSLRLDCGTEDRFLPVNRALHQVLEARGVPHDYEETRGGHDWSYWLARLPGHVAWHAARLRDGAGPAAEPRISSRD